MKNLMLDVVNYRDVNGKSYGTGYYGCNYPLIDKGVLLIGCTNGSSSITTTGDFTLLLGGSIQNNNIPLYKYLVSDSGFVVEIKYVISSTEAELATPFAPIDGDYAVVSVDVFGQPPIAQCYAINSTAFAPINAHIYTLYGEVDIEVGNYPVVLGSDPFVLPFGTSFAQSALNIEYETHELS